MIRRIPRVQQHDATDCGAACLRSVAAYHGLRVSIARIRQHASTDRQGTNVLGLVEAASRIGLTAKGVKGPPACLARVPTPAIAHVVVGALRHYVVLYRATRTHAIYMDPADGRVHRRPLAEFAAGWTGVLVLLAPGDASRTGRDVTPARRFWSLLRPHRGVLAQAAVGAAFYTLLGLSTSIYVQKVVDYVLVDGNRNLLNLMSVLMLGILAVQMFVGTMKSRLSLQTGQKIDGALILGYYNHLLSLPQSFFDTMQVGEIVSRIGDAVKIRAFINDVSVDLLVNALVVVFSLALMFLYSRPLALLTLGVVPLYLAIYAAANRVNRRAQRRLMERGADLQAQVVESLNAMATIKHFGLEPFSNLKTEVRFVRLLREVYASGSAAILSGGATELVSRLFTLLLLWMGAGLVVDRALTPGQLMCCYALIGYLTGPIGRLVAANRTVQDALIAADRLFEILDLEREETAGRIALTPAMVGDIRFQGVRFRYGTRAEVFHGLDLRIAHGRVTAIVGESGSGKSTLLALLQNLYPVEAGRVCIGDVDVRHAGNDSLRRLIGVVPQRIELFSGDVVENIAAGDFEPDLERVLALGRELGINELVERLPQGYRTPLGENGATLSGGERQRIAIARALYRDPEVIVLDEATASLDPVSESHVQAAMQRLKQRGKTVVVITHRLSAVMAADDVVVLAHGAVAERGTHAELLAARGAYHALWQAQFPSVVHIAGLLQTAEVARA